MTGEKRNKLNRLFKEWPRGTVATSLWLKQQGIYDQLVFAYQKSEWIYSIGHGAYVRCDDQFDWMGGIYAIQKHLGKNIFVGSKTALQMHGYTQYIPLGKGYPVTLFGSPGEILPVWFRKYPWDVQIRYVSQNLFNNLNIDTLVKKQSGLFAIMISIPERAILEFLSQVPRRESFEEALQLMESLTMLRISLLTELLQKCNSIKTKRLFMFLAEFCNHQYFKDLKMLGIDLGKGKRVVVKGGYLDKKYNITVPKTLKDENLHE